MEHGNKINCNISKYDAVVAKGKKIYSQPETAKQRATFQKHMVMENLEKYLGEFENNFTKK